MDHSGQVLIRLVSLLWERSYCRKVFWGASLIVLGVTAALAQVTPSYYVSGTNGNDSWSGTLAAPNTTNSDGPFKTLGRAQSAMQGSTTKTVTIRSGSYSIQSTNLTFGWQDAGETWTAYPGETVTLDGGGTGYISASGVDNLTFAGLVIRRLGTGPYGSGMFLKGSGITVRGNTFLTCTISCISGSGLTYAVIDNNVLDGQSPGNPPGSTYNAYSAIMLWYGSSNNRITHNLIKNAQGGGIAFSAGPSDPPSSNNIVDRNILQNVNTNVFDNGALYMMDRTHTAVGNQITNNIVDGNGGVNFLSNWTKAIYIDDLMSNVLVSGNICRNCGQYAVQYHGGDHISVVNNIFDLTGGALPGFYQTVSGSTGMAGNTFQRNIVYFADNAPSSLWQLQLGSNDVRPDDRMNLYYSATGAPIPNNTIVDTNPYYANPQFANPNVGDYSMPLTSPAYTQIQFLPLPTDQGPLSYTNISPPTNVRVIQVSP